MIRKITFVDMAMTVVDRVGGERLIPRVLGSGNTERRVR